MGPAYLTVYVCDRVFRKKLRSPLDWPSHACYWKLYRSLSPSHHWAVICTV